MVEYLYGVRADRGVGQIVSERTQSGSGLDSEWTPERVALAGRHMAIVLGAGIAIGLFAAAMQLYYICALIGMLLLAGLVAWQFESTLALYALIAFIPFGRTPDIAIGGSGVGKGLYVSELMLGFLLAIWILKYIWGNLPQNRIKSAFYLPSGLYLVFCLINVWNSFLLLGSARQPAISVSHCELHRNRAASAECGSAGYDGYFDQRP